MVDKTHASLSSVNSQLVEALNIYCSLMKENATYSTIQSPYIQQPPHSQHISSPNYNPILNQQQHLSYGQPQVQQLPPNVLPSNSLPYSNPQLPYVSMPAMNSMQSVNGSFTPTSAAYNPVYSPAGSQANTSTTYTNPNQIHYGDTSSQQPQINPAIGVDPNGQQQMINYIQSPQQPTLHTNQQ